MSGYSPMQYLLRRRVGEAQTLLITTDLPIAEIAGRVGYDTQSYFNLQFTRHVGMPPKRYRQNYIVKAKNETPGRTKK
jgi:AraC-like DNA-binding protein